MKISRELKILALIPALFIVSNCKDVFSSEEDVVNAADEHGAHAATVSERVAAVRAEIVARNFGKAAELGRGAVTAFPLDPSAAFELARAEALAGNEGYALDALDDAVSKGLANAAAALRDDAFNSLRRNARFRAIERKASPASGRAAPVPQPSPRPTVSAGQGRSGVEIFEGNGGTRIRAGDVVLETDF